MKLRYYADDIEGSDEEAGAVTTVTNAGSLTISFRDGTYDPGLIEFVLTSAMFSSGDYFNAVVSTPDQSESISLSPSFLNGDYFETIITICGNIMTEIGERLLTEAGDGLELESCPFESASQSAIFLSGVYFATIIFGPNQPDAGTLSAGFSNGVYFLQVVSAPDQPESVTLSASFKNGVYI